MLNNILTKCNLLPSNKHKLYNDKTWNGFCETTNTSGKRLGKLCNRLLYKQNNGEKICYVHYKLQQPEENNLDKSEKYCFSNGDIYEGDWIGYKRDGSGRMIFSNGNIYEGNWEDDMKQGKGKMIYSNGDTYEGNWVNNIMEGKGKMNYYNGDSYEGNWKKMLWKEKVK